MLTPINLIKVMVQTGVLITMWFRAANTWKQLVSSKRGYVSSCGCIWNTGLALQLRGLHVCSEQGQCLRWAVQVKFKLETHGAIWGSVFVKEESMN